MRVVPPPDGEPDFVQPLPLDEILSKARSAREKIVSELRDELAALDAATEALRAQLAQLDDERKGVAAALDKLAPTPKTQKIVRRTGGGRNAATRQREEAAKRERVLDTIRTLDEPFSAPQLTVILKEREGDDDMAIGRKFITDELRRLHDAGAVAVDRRAQNGGFIYRRLGPDDA